MVNLSLKAEKIFLEAFFLEHNSEFRSVRYRSTSGGMKPLVKFRWIATFFFFSKEKKSPNLTPPLKVRGNREQL